MYILHGFSITGAKILRYFDATKYFGVKMTRKARILIIPSYLSMKEEELFGIFCNDVTIKAKVPTRHEQAPSYYEKKFLVRSISMEQALSMTMYTCIFVYMYSCIH